MVSQALFSTSAACAILLLVAPAMPQDVSATVTVRDARQYDVTRYEWTDYPQVYVYRYETPELKRLYLIADPTHQLAQAPIEAPSGRFIGKVRNVETGPDGAPHRIEVALNRAVSVWVTPGHFRFDPASHVLFTDLTREDLWGMPGATVQSGFVDRS